MPIHLTTVLDLINTIFLLFTYLISLHRPHRVCSASLPDKARPPLPHLAVVKHHSKPLIPTATMSSSFLFNLDLSSPPKLSAGGDYYTE